MTKMLIMATPITSSERYEFKLLATMARDAGYQLRVAERITTGDSLCACVDYNHINERHKADVDEAFTNGRVFVVNGMTNMASRGAIELHTMGESPIEKFAEIVGRILTREEKIITALLADKGSRNRKLRELGATSVEIRSAAAKIANF